jgi:chromosome segregation ATPase
MSLTPTLLTALAGMGGVLLGSLANLLRSRSQNRLDESSASNAEAARELTMVKATRELIDGVRAEMTTMRSETDAKVDELRREVAYLKGALDSAKAELDTLRRVEQALRADNATLRSRNTELESRVEQLTDGLSQAAQATTPVIVDRRTTT